MTNRADKSFNHCHKFEVVTFTAATNPNYRLETCFGEESLDSIGQPTGEEPASLFLIEKERVPQKITVLSNRNEGENVG